MVSDRFSQGGRGSGLRHQISFAGQLQRTRTADDALTLAEAATSPSDVAAALERLGQLAPLADGRAAEAAAIRTDARLARTVARLAEGSAPPPQRCAALWALALLFPQGSEVPLLFPSAAREISMGIPADVPPTLAAHALWGCETLWIAAPPPILRAASRLPFRLHVGGASVALGGGSARGAAAVAGMVGELPIRRDAIASGSAVCQHLKAHLYRKHTAKLLA